MYQTAHSTADISRLYIWNVGVLKSLPWNHYYFYMCINGISKAVHPHKIIKIPEHNIIKVIFLLL